MFTRIIIMCLAQMLLAGFTYWYGVKRKSIFWQMVGFFQSATCAYIIIFMLIYGGIDG